MTMALPGYYSQPDDYEPIFQDGVGDGSHEFAINC